MARTQWYGAKLGEILMRSHHYSTRHCNETVHLLFSHNGSANNCGGFVVRHHGAFVGPCVEDLAVTIQ